MDRLKTTFITAFVIAILFAPTASAQAVAAKVEVISGNGQMICPACGFGFRDTTFYPMVVKVTDVNGLPIANKTVNWQLVTANGTTPFFEDVTRTNANGLSASRLSQGAGQGGSNITPFVQTVIGATVDALSVNFTETVALIDANGSKLVLTEPGWASGSTPVLRGPQGSTGTVPIQVRVIGGGSIPVPNVSLRLLSPDPNTPPVASCATGPGADRGGVLTDATGLATCYPVFGSVPGVGSVDAAVAGLDPAQFDQSITNQPLDSPISYFGYGGIQVTVDRVVPGRVTIVSGNNQNVDPGGASAPLVVQVTDASGAQPIGSTKVDWIVTGAATASPSQSTTDSQGRAQTTVTFSPNAVGQVSVRAALTGANSGIANTFTLNTRVLIASFTKVSGDQQTAQAGQNFGAPLVVQVIGTNGQPVLNQPVSFSVNGGANLSASSAVTDGNGRAQITVTAGATPGTVTVTAFTGTLSQVFTLTIIPPGPALSASSLFNAGGVSRIAALSPCSLVTVVATGLAPNVQGLVFNTNAYGPWATTLATDTVTVNNVAAPIYSVGKVGAVEQLTFQVPCEAVPASSVPITVNVGGGTATVNFPVVAASPSIFETVMSDGVRRAVAIRPDGSFVSPLNPARRGDVVRVFVTGLGPAAPALVTGALPFAGADSLVLGQVIVGVNNAGARVVTSRAAPNLIGVYELAFEIPSDAPAGSDVVLSVAVNAPGDNQTRFSNGSKLPIQ